MDGIVAALRVSQMVDEAGGSCAKLMKSVPEYPVLRDFIPCPDQFKHCFMEKIAKCLTSEISGITQVIENDGVRVECGNGSYVLVRASGTEPKVRLYIGARTEKTLAKLEKITREVMLNTLKECGAV